MKRKIVYILVVAAALALWELYLEGLYLKSVGIQNLPGTSVLGVTMVGYVIVLTSATLISYFLTREGKK
jgi:hypothetical protein